MNEAQFGRQKIGFNIGNEIECQDQSSPKFTGIFKVLGCISVPNLEITEKGVKNGIDKLKTDKFWLN